jgi:hypothetical protein
MKLKLLLFLSLAVMAAPAFAGPLIFQLNPSLGYGAPGGPAIIFFGTLQYLNIVPDMNDPAFEMDLNDISVTFTPPNPNLTPDPTGQPLSVPDDFFFNTVVGNLLADGQAVDDTYLNSPIFEIFVAPGTPVGKYNGSISILGGFSDHGALDVLATQSFQVVVTPEPAMAGLVLTGLAGLAIAGCRRRRNGCA